MSFESHIAQIQNAENFAQGLDAFKKIASEMGFPHYFITVIQTDSSPSFLKAKYFNTNYPEAWVSDYIEKQYFFIDPVAKMVLNNESPFYWSEKVDTSTLQPEAFAMMEEAASHGVIDGIGLSYKKSHGFLTTLTVSTDTPLDHYDKTILAQFYLLGEVLVACYDKYNHEHSSPITLTDKEKVIVTHAVIGKTDPEIAQLMDISVNTVRFHWKNIFQKLDSYSRVYAIIRAVNLELIDTDIFEIPTETGSSKTYQKAV